MTSMQDNALRSPWAARSLAVAGCLALAILAVPGCRKADEADSADSSAASAALPQAQLSIANAGGVIRYSGRVRDAATQVRISDTFDHAFGRGRASGNVDAASPTQPAEWIDGLAALLPELDVPGAMLLISGRELRLEGQVAPRDRARLLKAVRDAYPGYATTGLFAGVDPEQGTSDAPAAAVTTPRQKAAVVQALNTIDIGFDDGAGSVSDASLAGVAGAARTLASTPDLRVRIALAAGGNEALARQRAEALKVQLIINGVSPGAIETSVLPAGAGTASNTVTFSAADAAVK